MRKEKKKITPSVESVDTGCHYIQYKCAAASVDTFDCDSLGSKSVAVFRINSLNCASLGTKRSTH